MNTPSLHPAFRLSLPSFIWNRFTAEKNVQKIFVKAQWLGMSRDEAISSILGFLRERAADIALSADQFSNLWDGVERELSPVACLEGAE